MTRSRRLLALFGVLAVLAAGAAVWYRLRIDRDIRSQTLFIPKQAHMTPELQLLQQYVRIDTTNPPGNETAGARFLAGVLARGGVHAEVIESAPGRGNVYARLKGRTPGQALLLLSHIDVVAAKGTWTRPPFAGSVYLNDLWGRGTLDMKGVGICELAAFLGVARSGRQPERDLIFLATADEESGGEMGVRWLLEHRPDVFDGVRYALNEGGVTETQAEKITYVGIEIGSKMSVSLRLRAPTLDALRRARIALEPAMTPVDPERILPEVKEFFRAIAPMRREQGAWLGDIDKAVKDGKFWLLQRGYRELTQNNVWVDGAKADARGATMLVRLYNLPDENPDARIAWLAAQVAPFGATVEEVLTRNGPAPLSRMDTPFFGLLRQAVKQEMGDAPIGPEILAASSNDSRFLRARGVVAYGIWPFPVDFYQTQGIHGVDERVRLDWFVQGVSLMRRVVSAYAFAAGERPAT
jgi:acetylornithine deacetylase/succinyl-diaminopimelate desuccinylase-like protein